MKLLAVIALIGMTATPALAGGPRVRHRQTHYEGVLLQERREIYSWLLQQTWTMGWWICR